MNSYATGRGRSPRTRLDKDGFPRGIPDPVKTAGWLPDRGYGQSRGHHRKKERDLSGSRGRRASGCFTIHAAQGLIPGICHRFCALIQRTDRYGDRLTKIASKKGDAGMGQAEPAALSLLDRTVSLA